MKKENEKKRWKKEGGRNRAVKPNDVILRNE